jgi:Metallo-beta-lactamase superfamily
LAIMNTRLQLPVGQGFFHAGWIRFAQAEDGFGARLHKGPEGFFYIYDCGAMNKYASSRDREIAKLISRVSKRARLDLLIISHMHADHVNGVEKLVTDGEFQVDTIMMPMVDVKERLLAFASVAHSDPKSTQSAFYRDMVADPVSAVSRFNPRNILLVRRGDAGSPGGGSRDDGPLDGDPGTLGEGRGYAWKLVGQGVAEPRTRERGMPRVMIIPDSSGTKVFATGGWDEAWLLAPYVDQEIVATMGLFLATLAKKCSMTEKGLEANLLDANFVLGLLTNHVDDLKTAYMSCHGNLNLTSLCLYSGPSAAVAAENGCRVDHGPWTSALQQNRVAWLGTGDARLSKVSKCEAFLDHFRGHLEKVSTFTLPHHGSAHDFSKKLLSTVKPGFCIVAADAVNKWQHPAALVTRAVASAGAILLVANSDEATAVREIAWTHSPRA